MHPFRGREIKITHLTVEAEGFIISFIKWKQFKNGKRPKGPPTLIPIPHLLCWLLYFGKSCSDACSSHLHPRTRKAVVAVEKLGRREQARLWMR